MGTVQHRAEVAEVLDPSTFETPPVECDHAMCNAMRRALLLSLVMFLAACGSASRKALPASSAAIPCSTTMGTAAAPLPPVVADPEGAAILRAWGLTGTFLLYDVRAQTLTATDPARVTERALPASTFKIPHTLIGLETGVIPGREFTLRWDGKHRSLPGWNRDTDLASAMKYSVVWYFQEVARRIGQERMQRWLDRLNYGNRTIGEAPDSFWLDGSLTITPLEQMRFLDRLRQRALPFAREHMALVDEITTLDAGPGWSWRGKTGTQTVPGKPPVAWLVGSTDRDDRSWVYALYLTGKPDQDAAPMVRARKEVVRVLLARDGALPASSTGSDAHPASSLPQPTASGAPTTEVALTFDDLPKHGPLASGQTRLSVHRDILATLAKHGVQSAVGFVVGKQLEDADAEAAVDAWVAAGHPIGSHTFSHPSPFKVPLEAYLRDIDEDESVLVRLARGHDFHWFRFPYLQEGPDLDYRAAIRKHLAKKGYRIAQATIDFNDWAYSQPYVRCLKKKDTASLKALKESFIAHARASLRWSVAAAEQMLGRPIPQVLLLHVGTFEALVLDDLLTAYEKEGVRFISLEEAHADPALSVETEFTAEWGSTLLEQIVETRNVSHPPMVPAPLPLLEQLCR
jgi:peptidoglycan-N-acetylglucosamine deacetylase